MLLTKLWRYTRLWAKFEWFNAKLWFRVKLDYPKAPYPPPTTDEVTEFIEDFKKKGIDLTKSQPMYVPPAPQRPQHIDATITVL